MFSTQLVTSIPDFHTFTGNELFRVILNAFRGSLLTIRFKNTFDVVTFKRKRFEFIKNNLDNFEELLNSHFPFPKLKSNLLGQERDNVMGYVKMLKTKYQRIL